MLMKNKFFKTTIGIFLLPVFIMTVIFSVYIFKNNENLQEIEIIIRLIDEDLHIIFTDDGEIYNPFLNENLMKSDNIRELSKLKCKFEYDEILGFNKEYIIFKK